MDSRADEVIRVQFDLENERSNWDAHYREIGEYVLPRQNDFQGARTEGAKRTERIFDSTAPLALDRAASAVDSLITPASQQYHKLEPEDPALVDDFEVMRYLDEVTKILFRLRYKPMANFGSQSHECYTSLMAFGTMGMFVDDVLGRGLRYKSIAMSELYIAENKYGIVDLVHRKFPLTIRQAVQKFGLPKLPEKIQKLADKEPLRKFDFIHAVSPNEERKRGDKSYKSMPIRACYVLAEERHLIEEGGFRRMPYAVSRHVTSPREVYGRSPAMAVLADIKMLNEMEKTVIRAAQKVVDPPLLAYGDGILSAFSLRPGAINYGGVDESGKQMVVPMKMGSNLPIALEMTEQKRKVVNDAFYVTLFQILVQNPQMTATEALIRAQEKGQLLAPTVGRQQSEFLGPIIDRELDIASMAGLLPPMPAKLIDRGGVIKAVYTSPLSRLRRADDGVSIMRTVESLAPIAQVDPSVYDVFDSKELAYELADIHGVPKKVLRSREQIEQRAAEREQAAATQQLLAGAETAAGAAESLGKAAQAAGSVALPAGVQ